MRTLLLPAAVFFCFGIATSVLSDESPFLPILSTINENYRAYIVRGDYFSDGSIHVWITTKTGTVVFESRYPVQKGGEKYLEWEFRGDPAFSRSTLIDDRTFPTLKGMTFAGKDIVRMLMHGQTPETAGGITALAKTLRPRPMDNYGCDSPFELMQCTSNGNCCDAHDDCYRDFGCHAISWLGIGSPLCTMCNEAMVACIVGGLYNTGQPSECCALGICGAPRPAQEEHGSGGTPGNDGGTLNRDPDGGGGNVGGISYNWIYTPWGFVAPAGGWCTFPDGTVVPCG